MKCIKIKLQNECPSDAVLEVLMTGSTNRPALKMSSEGPAVMTPFTGVATNAPLAVKNSGTTVWLDASGTNAIASLEYRIAPSGGGHLVSDSQPIRVVDTSIDERWIKKDTYTTYDFSDSTTNIYWEAWSYEDWSCVDFGVGGSFEVGPNLPIGDYEVYAYFADMVTDNLSYGTLHVVDTDIAEDEYAVQCGTTNRVEVSLDTADSYGPADWRIEPVLEDGARLYASESGGTGSTTFSDGTRVWVSAGDIATNYTVTAYYPECTNAMDTAVVHVISLEFNGLHYFIQRGSTNRNEVSSFVENMNGCDLDWSLSPGLSNGARISSQSTGGSEDLSLSGFADVYIKAGFVATNYVLTAHHGTFSNIVNSAEVSVIGIDIPEECYGMQSNATTRAHFTGAIENMDVADLTWEISPSISGGARLHAGPATPDGSATLTGSTNVWVSSGSICTNYTLKAYFRYVEEIEDKLDLAVLSFMLNRSRALMKSESGSTNLFTATASDNAMANWKIEPTSVLPWTGAKISDDKDAFFYQTAVDGTNTVWVNPGDAGTNYVITAAHAVYTNVTVSAELGVADIRLEPISVETNANGLAYNPSGVPTGEYREFKIDVKPEYLLPDEGIYWNAGTAVSFRDGVSTGRVVAATTSSSVKQTMSVGLRDYVGPPPEISFQCRTPQSIPVRFMIVTKLDGTDPATSPENTTNLIAGVNKIFDQTGISFYIGGISYTNREEWLTIDTEETSAISNLCSSLPAGSGFQVYVVNLITEGSSDGPAGFNLAWGTVMEGNLIPGALAHEFGHQCGWPDIYPHHEDWPETVSGPVSSARLPGDWTGAGNYYKCGLSQSDLINQRLVMCGYVNSLHLDIPCGYVYGLYSFWVEGVQNFLMGNADIGLDSMDAPIRSHYSP